MLRSLSTLERTIRKVAQKAEIDPEPTSTLRMAATAQRSIADVTRIIASVTEASPVQRIIMHIGEPAGPPAWDGFTDALPDWEALAQPEPEYLFDQQVQW